MKLKQNLFCITDNYNKPDFRYLFEDRKDAEKKINKIKNSTKGETIFLSNYRRDFFVDGVKRKIIHPQKQIDIKNGCWTTLKVKKMALLSDTSPESFFGKTKKAKKHHSSFSKSRTFEALAEFNKQPLPRSSSFFEFDWQASFLRTKSFATACIALVLMTFGMVFAIQHKTANKINDILVAAQVSQTQKTVAVQAQVIENKESVIDEQFNEELDKLVLETLKSFENLKDEEFRQELKRILAGYPMEEMIPYIARQDRKVAAFLVGIGKKESNWGKRVPVLNGQDCYNYWGYRGIRARMGSGGHTCFDSPEDAVNTVGGRLGRLVNADVDTPQEMVLWKCGSACHKDPMAGKWIRDVGLYFSKVDEGA